ncbi:MAG TPA: nitroreductase family protein [Planctomycetota bacterium]|nr:nitroreductase family protein [Planctomycetota bacterium]
MIGETLKEIAPGFMDVIRARRSIREFLPTPVPEAAIEQLLEAASLAPSSCNRQPWRFVLVRDRAVLEKMGASVKARFDELRSAIPVGELVEEMEMFRVFFSFFETAPLVVVACYREMPDLLARIVARAGSATPVDTVSGIHPELQSLSLAVMSLVLAATNLGLATSVTTGPLIARDAIKEHIGLSRHWEIATLVPVGYARGEPGERPRRKDLTQVATFL